MTVEGPAPFRNRDSGVREHAPRVPLPPGPDPPRRPPVAGVLRRAGTVRRRGHAQRRRRAARRPAGAPRPVVRPFARRRIPALLARRPPAHAGLGGVARPPRAARREPAAPPVARRTAREVDRLARRAVGRPAAGAGGEPAIAGKRFRRRGGAVAHPVRLRLARAVPVALPVAPRRPVLSGVVVRRVVSGATPVLRAAVPVRPAHGGVVRPVGPGGGAVLPRKRAPDRRTAMSRGGA